jgi:hypothetical protein
MRELQQGGIGDELGERAGDLCETLPHADMQRCEKQRPAVATKSERAQFGQSECRGGRLVEPEVGGEAYGLPHWLDGYWKEEPDIPRAVKGAKSRRRRLKALGNAVVPAQAYAIFKAIVESENDYDEDKN